MRRIAIIVILLAVNQVFAQSPADWWYFGNTAGMHFTPTGPVADTNGAMNTGEGCASISSAQGDLLFYTDGTWVYNAQHNVMPNGDSLLGNGSSTQSSVIIPYPGNSDKYFIFTARGCSGGSTTGQIGYLFAYSVVDMTLNGGLGDVLTAEKNIVLFDSSAEKCTAALHANGQDIWVVGREQNDEKFYAYRVSSQGVIDTVISDLGGTQQSCAGYLLANHEGNKIASANYSDQEVHVYDFDQQTGQLQSNPLVISTTPGAAYGVHFSPNDELLYAGLSTQGVRQWDLTAANVQNSMTTVSDSGVTTSYWGIAEGPDEKLYIARLGGSPSGYLACINDPDQVGTACNFIDTAVFLAGRNSSLGLPNNVAPGLFSISAMDIDGFCLGGVTSFGFDTTNINSAVWNFGDSNSSNNTSTQFFPTHTYSDTGLFTVTLVATFDTLVDTLTQTVRIYPRQEIDLGLDSLLCEGDTVFLDISQPYSSYLWSDSTTSDSKTITTSQTVWATVFGVCDTVSDTVTYQFDEPISFDLGPDTSFCEGGTLFLDADINVEALIFWNTGDSVDNIIVTESGFYEINAINGCGPFIDNITVEVYPNPDSVLLPPDTLNCFDNSITLERPNTEGVEYYWSDSTQRRSYVVDTTETVWLSASSECGILVDTISIVFNGEIQTELGEDTVICDEDSILLFGIDSAASYDWNTGDSTDTIITTPEVSQNYMVTITLRQCQRVEQRFVESNALACPSIDCDLEATNIFTPNGDGINDVFRITSDCEIFSYDLYVYNRWGQLVHVSRNKNFGWDGFVNGEPASEGVYYYTVEYKDPVVVDADRRVTQGSLTLLRD